MFPGFRARLEVQPQLVERQMSKSSLMESRSEFPRNRRLHDLRETLIAYKEEGAQMVPTLCEKLRHVMRTEAL
jgi:hypothetical protein